MTTDDVRATFLAGESDGDDLSPEERERLSGIRARLADETVWTPKQGGDARSRLLAAASAEAGAGSAPVSDDGPRVDAPVADAPEAGGAPEAGLRSVGAPPEVPKPRPRPAGPGPAGPTDRRPGPEAEVVDLAARRERSSSRGARIALQLAATAAAVFVAFWLGGQLTENADDGGEVALTVTATHDLIATELDPDATGTILVMPTPAGVQLELQLMGLDNAEGTDYYAAWLMGPNGDAIQLGTFHWRAGGVPIILWSGVDDPTYNRLMVTRQQQGDPAGPSSETVLTADLPDLTAG